MGGAKNRVIAGDYTGRRVKKRFNRIVFSGSFKSPIIIDETTVCKYDVIDQESSKNGVSSFCRGLVGRFFLGNVGMIAGCLSGKNKSIIVMALEFFNGDKSLIEVDKEVYKAIVKKLFV